MFVVLHRTGLVVRRRKGWRWRGGVDPPLIAVAGTYGFFAPLEVIAMRLVVTVGGTFPPVHCGLFRGTSISGKDSQERRRQSLERCSNETRRDSTTSTMHRSSIIERKLSDYYRWTVRKRKSCSSGRHQTQQNRPSETECGRRKKGGNSLRKDRSCVGGE